MSRACGHPGSYVLAGGLSQRAGVTGVGRDSLTEQHWSGRAWSPEHFVVEEAYSFRSSPAAQQYARAWARPDPACECDTPYGRATTRRVAGVVVQERRTTSNFGAHRTAAFVVGRLAVTLLIDVRNGSPTDTEFDALVAKAVSRALLH